MTDLKVNMQTTSGAASFIQRDVRPVITGRGCEYTVQSVAHELETLQSSD